MFSWVKYIVKCIMKCLKTAIGSHMSDCLRDKPSVRLWGVCLTREIFLLTWDILTLLEITRYFANVKVLNARKSYTVKKTNRCFLSSHTDTEMLWRHVCASLVLLCEPAIRVHYISSLCGCLMVSISKTHSSNVSYS